MKQLLLIVCCLICFFIGNTQYNLRLVVNNVATKKLDDIFLGGNFNNWNPTDKNYKLKPFGTTRKAIVLKTVPAGKYEFKFTRGNWNKVETTAKGEAIANRSIELNSDTTIDINIEGWSDDFPDKPKPNTATAQVKIIDTAFYIPQLNRTRRIWIYLPASYYNQNRPRFYPVLYMHDGQNLFNEQTAAFGEWGIDECLDSLQKQTRKDCIIVGIDNGLDKRMHEYNPYNKDVWNDRNRSLKGEGDQYIEFIVKTLKPFIDKNYKTLKDVSHTYIAGSSMGGVISLYALIKYPEVFGAAGIFSPAFWVTPQLYTEVETANWTSFPRFYFYVGGKEEGKEGAIILRDMNKMADIIEKKNRFDVRRAIYPPGEHNEAAWRKEFPDFYRWLMK